LKSAALSASNGGDHEPVNADMKAVEAESMAAGAAVDATAMYPAMSLMIEPQSAVARPWTALRERYGVRFRTSCRCRTSRSSKRDRPSENPPTAFKRRSRRPTQSWTAPLSANDRSLMMSPCSIADAFVRAAPVASTVIVPAWTTPSQPALISFQSQGPSDDPRSS